MECRVCKSTRVSPLCKIPNEESNTDVLESYRCEGCGAAFIGNEVSENELSEAYSELDSEQYYDDIDETTKQKMSSVVADVSGEIPRSAKILDIGAGGGHLLKTLHASGFEELYAHEIPTYDLDEIEEVTVDVYQDFDYRTIPTNEFDLVTLIDVLEHVPDPMYLIGQCKRVLKEGGTIYLHTPVLSRLDRIMHSLLDLPAVGGIGRAWQRSRTSIFHLSIYTPTALALLLEEYGFLGVSIRTTNELSWPISKYIDTYIAAQTSLPMAAMRALYPFVAVVLKSRFFNSNKAVVSARS